MKRGLGGRGPHVTALLSGFMGAKLPEGEARVFRGLCPHGLGRAPSQSRSKASGLGVVH